MIGSAKERELWSSRAGFIMASMGAAVGFGNVWRFPALAYSYGGGAFFIPYLIALFFIGIPLLILEVALGQFYRTGDIGAFGGLNTRLRGVGVGSLTCSYCVVLYYIPLIAWTLRAFFESFSNFDENYKESSGGDAYEYFLFEIIGMSTLGEDLRPTRIVWENWGYLILVYFILFLCVGFGVKTTGRISYFTMGFPILLLFIFLIRAATLEGATEGVKAYIGRWDMDVLADRGDVWSTAVSQIFFSIGVTFGIFTAYGSSNPKDAPIVADSLIIALANSLFSFIAGFAVFSTLGHLAFKQGLPVDEVATSGPGLVFGTYPVVLAGLPNGEHWVRLFFAFLFFLGIDSGFGLSEAVLIVIGDTPLGNKYSKMSLAAVFMVVCAVIDLLFVTDAGFLFLDVVDFYVNFILLLVGFFEVFGAGWVFGIEDQIKKLGKTPVFLFMFTTFGSLIFGSCFWYGLSKNNVWAGFVAFLLFYAIGFVATMVSLNSVGNMTFQEKFYALTMENVVALRDLLASQTSSLPLLWAFFIKHILPSVLLMCFINLCATKDGDGKPIFGNYEGYVNAPYQIIGIIVVILTMIVFTLGVIFPGIYEGLLSKNVIDTVDAVNGVEKKIEEDLEEKASPEEALDE